MNQKEKFSFDTRCYDLALYFLSDDKASEHVRPLAQTIQDAIEDYLQMIEPDNRAGI